MHSDARIRLGLVAVPVVLGLALLTSGCNTMRGMGEDVSAAGSGISGTAEKTEEKIEDGMSESSDAAEEAEEKTE